MEKNLQNSLIPGRAERRTKAPTLMESLPDQNPWLLERHQCHFNTLMRRSLRPGEEGSVHRALRMRSEAPPR